MWAQLVDVYVQQVLHKEECVLDGGHSFGLWACMAKLWEWCMCQNM